MPVNLFSSNPHEMSRKIAADTSNQSAMTAPIQEVRISRLLCTEQRETEQITAEQTMELPARPPVLTNLNGYAELDIPAIPHQPVSTKSNLRVVPAGDLSK